MRRLICDASLSTSLAVTAPACKIQSHNPTRPRRPVAVKRLRRSSASLRPLRGDCAGSARQGAIQVALLSESGPGAAFRQQRDLQTKRQRRAEPSRFALATAQRLDLYGEHGDGGYGASLQNPQSPTPARPRRPVAVKRLRRSCAPLRPFG